MLGSRLARRIVIPVLVLVGALMALLGWAAVRVADSQVQSDLEQTADRVATTLDELRVAPEHRPPILRALEHLVDARIAVGAAGDWKDHRILERRSKSGPSRYFIGASKDAIAGRTRDALRPVIWTGAVGLLVAALLGLVVARAIARPVKELADEARQFAAGDQDIAVGQGGPGEIGELQEAFARMLSAIREGETKLRESERFAALGRLAGGIAHELRNPLTAIRMAVETAIGGNEEAKKIAVSEIERLDRTLREMLDYVRPRKPTRVPVPLAELFAEIAALLGPQCEHLNVQLDVDTDTRQIVSADKDRLKQALLNLVLNAAQAQPYGGAVRVRATEEGITVADDGPGIPDEVRESLLQPFVTTKEAGIGLGLAVVQQVADEHEAELDFRTDSSGTTFTISLCPKS